MSLREKLRLAKKIIKHVVIWGSGTFFISYQVYKTRQTINRVVNPDILDKDKKGKPEYIYIDDPSYGTTLRQEQDKESRRPMGILRMWKSLRHSLAWRLLWLCRHGNKEQRNIALVQLASFKKNKHWDCLKLAQAMDKQTAVLLARTQGADLRYFLPPPIHVRRAALSPELLSYKYRDMISAVEQINPHSCIEHFLSKYFANVHEQVVESENIPAKPDSISERDLCLLCLDALHHHISLFYDQKFEDDKSCRTLIEMGLLPKLAELMLRHREDSDMDYNVLRVLTVLSVHHVLLKDFFQNGLIKELSRLLRAKELRLASSAAVCLTNLSGEYCYRPGLYLLHPLYRTTKRHVCDTLLVHGLRGGVFVTWRQRDKKCAQPVGIVEVTISNPDCEYCEDHTTEDRPFALDPELKQVIEDLKELDELALLSDFEVVLHDLPTEIRREDAKISYTATNRYTALLQENQDRCKYSSCWPKDWLPKDCSNLRILGVNYWSSLSEWLERCPIQTAEISVRAADFAPTLLDADVGKGNTPVVWLAHSMGGLIVKQMLIDAANSEEAVFHRLCDNTKAVFFYSTPHKGSAVVAMPRPAAAILWPSNDVRQLQENSPVLLQLHEDFVKYAEAYNWETISFVESLPTLVTAFKVPIQLVESASADIGRGVMYILPLDHLSICKPATRQSILYTSVLDVINKVTKVDEELEYSNPFMQWVLYIFLYFFSFLRVEETKNDCENERLQWYAQILLDTFSDF